VPLGVDAPVQPNEGVAWMSAAPSSNSGLISFRLFVVLPNMKKSPAGVRRG
jgi:hypothetical protein